MSLSGILPRTLARAALLTAGILLVGPPALAAQADQDGSADRVVIDDPPAPVGDAMINQAFQDGATLRAVRATEPFEIDGVLDEAFYQRVPAISEFVQAVPIEDGEPSELTETWISQTGTYYVLVSLDVEKFSRSVSEMEQLTERTREAVVDRAEREFRELDEGV